MQVRRGPPLGVRTGGCRRRGLRASGERSSPWGCRRCAAVVVRRSLFRAGRVRGPERPERGWGLGLGPALSVLEAAERRVWGGAGGGFVLNVQSSVRVKEGSEEELFHLVHV